MFSKQLSQWTLTFSTLGLLFAALLSSLILDESPILIESKESKTSQGQKVFNKIQYKREASKDIWLMEQSHHGVKAHKTLWDKIAIVVDKTQKPYTADFFQLEPGPQNISLNLKKIDFKVSCYMCHSNGPRAIRHNFASNEVKLSIWDQARIQLWNLKIKTYGKVKGQGLTSQHPFKHHSPLANQPLEINVCKKCHKENGWLARGKLTKQNFLAIRFMVDEGIMPPPGFSISEKEKEEIHQFLKL